MTTTVVPETQSQQANPHQALHSEVGARPGEHAGRHPNPVIKVRDIAWLEFQKPDLARAATFARDFGFHIELQTDTELQLRGSLPGSSCLLIRKGPKARFVGAAFHAEDVADLALLGRATGATPARLPETLGGHGIVVTDPAGQPVRVVAGTHLGQAIPSVTATLLNMDGATPRTNVAQFHVQGPAQVERLGHVVLERSNFLANLDWYLEHLGLIVSDFLYLDRQRERGPMMAFTRCDRATTPTDHHTLAMLLGPRDAYVHSAYQVANLDVLAAGGEHLLGRGYTRAWGIGRHIQGSQIFDYWRDPDKTMVEHFTDGDVFDSSLEAGWSEMSTSGLSQWGPSVTREFLGTKPSVELVRYVAELIAGLRADNDFDLQRLAGMIRSNKR